MLKTRSSALSFVRGPIQERLDRVAGELEAMVPAGFDLIDEVNEYLFANHGKMFRPTLLLLANEVGDRPTPEAVKLGAIVELLHVATLVHDDAVDHSVRRRGMPTVNARWTHQVAIIMGDYLYSRAVIEITELGDIEATKLLAHTANLMTVGEMRQLVSHDALQFSRADYNLLCECKTASLLATACELGAMSGAPGYREPLRGYGYELGMAFQIIDDLLDYTSSVEVTGKPRGQDLREHKVTLPLIAALERMSASDTALVERLFDDPEPSGDLVDEVIAAVVAAGGIEAARAEADRVAGRARERLGELPGGPACEALSLAVDYVVKRKR
jgi:octaprenyl-diphosphate synthase